VLRKCIAKPNVIFEFIQWDGDNLTEISEEVGEYCRIENGQLTVEGRVVGLGDYIVKTPEGEVYPCNIHLFRSIFQDAILNSSL